ncbi:Alpha/beta hydrolase family protein [Rosistilla carotiformis]|uniref:Alpha/beta hydrolase family protein n=1 Tax=Rosistilla carotiformis TaxID=2528017 RepID=A0A518K005_9BACT|nr:alpha/beta hydrolase [Rosistilla carotiformis]QDV71131.1 Alpha/beta hydrolase family protein [Rosistilla carotiformis]
MRTKFSIWLILLVAIMNQSTNHADEPVPESAGFVANLKLPTLGGVQFWTDLRWWYGWRIQQNKLTDQCRLLNPSNIRHFSGSREACDARLAAIMNDGPWPESPQRVVVCMHGLMRTHRSFASLGKRIEQETPATVIHFGYASTRAPVSEHARALRGLIESLPGQPQIDLVGHSMGNIVARHAIGDWQTEGDPAGVLDRLGRFVMQGPPNQGAQIAKRLQSTTVFEIITGTSGVQLGINWDELQQHLATPPCEFGIIAGAYDMGRFRNPLVDGDSDLIVSVEEAKLSGANDFVIVPVLHSFLMDDKDVQELTLRFLETGAFAADGQRNPLP